MTESDLTARIRSVLPDAEVHCEDLTGTQDHWRLVVISRAFADKPLIAQHRLVKDALKAEMRDGRIHALSLKTWTRAAWDAQPHE